LLLERGKERVVVDAGLGDRAVARAVRGFFGGLSAGSGLERALAELGWANDSVTHVILTHLHVDHVGGAFDGSGRPTFPRAATIVARRELNYALNPHQLRGPVYDSRAAGFLACLKDIELVDGMPKEVLKGVEVILLGGHSPGLLGLKVETSRGVLFVPSDLIPTRAHRRPRWVLSYDQDPATVYEQRRRLVTRAMAHAWIIYFGHDPLVAFGRLRAGGDVESVPGTGWGVAQA
jgi:glyoxylase-like metal-dependent hydrolase (beta-lactamase superfamily II)